MIFKMIYLVHSCDPNRYYISSTDKVCSLMIVVTPEIWSNKMIIW